MNFDLLNIFLRLIIGLVIGFCIGLTGIGGGVLVLPALIILLKTPTSVAIGTASFYSFITKIHASYSHFKLKTIDSGIAWLLMAGAIPGNIFTSYIINQHIRNIHNSYTQTTAFQLNLKMFTALSIIVSAIIMSANIINNIRKEKNIQNRDLENKKPHIFITIFLGLMVGALMGSTSIGAVLVIPLLIIFFKQSSSKAVGTSIFITVILSFITSYIYITGMQIDFFTALIMVIGSFIGVHFGSKLSTKIPEKILQGIVICMIFISALIMLIKNGN